MTKLRRLLFLTTLALVAAVGLAAFAVGTGLAPTAPLHDAFDKHAAGSDSDPSRGLDACVHEGAATEIKIDVGTRGCFGGSDSSLELQRQGRQWTLTTREWADYGHHRVQSSTLSDEEAEALFDSLDDALEQPLWKLATCTSTNGVFTRVTTRCGAAVNEPLVLKTHECLNWSPDDDYGAPKSRSGQMWAWARARFAERQDAPVVEDSAEQQAKTAKSWGSLYQDGRRVRHDPVED